MLKTTGKQKLSKYSSNKLDIDDIFNILTWSIIHGLSHVGWLYREAVWDSGKSIVDFGISLSFNTGSDTFILSSLNLEP